MAVSSSWSCTDGSPIDHSGWAGPLVGCSLSRTTLVVPSGTPSQWHETVAPGPCDTQLSVSWVGAACGFTVVEVVVVVDSCRGSVVDVVVGASGADVVVVGSVTSDVDVDVVVTMVVVGLSGTG